MSELFDEHNPKICLEVIFKNSHEIYDVVIDANTKVLGGKVGIVDWEGTTFDDQLYLLSLFDDKQMAFIRKRPEHHHKVVAAIYKALEDVVDEIVEYEFWFSQGENS